VRTTEDSKHRGTRFLCKWGVVEKHDAVRTTSPWLYESQHHLPETSSHTSFRRDRLTRFHQRKIFCLIPVTLTYLADFSMKTKTILWLAFHCLPRWPANYVTTLPVPWNLFNFCTARFAEIYFRNRFISYMCYRIFSMNRFFLH